MIERGLFHSGPLPPLLAYLIGLVALALVLWPLWRELRRRRQHWRWALVVTRVGMVAIAVLLLAQPNLVTVRYTPESGQTLIVLDDSASMFVKDQSDDPQALLRLARQLALPAVADLDRTAAEQAHRLAELRRELAACHEGIAEAETAIRQAYPWPERARAAVANAATPLRALRAWLTQIEPDETQPAVVRQHATAALTALGSDDAGALVALAGGQLRQEQWEALARHDRQLTLALDALDRALLDLQHQRDLAFLDREGRRDLIAAELARVQRYELARRFADRLPTAAQPLVLNLAQGEATFDAAGAATRTDLIGPLVKRLADRPLDLFDAVILISDGGQNLAFDLDELAVFHRRRIPLLVAGIGGTDAQPPLRVDQVEAPGIVAKGRPFVLRIDLQSAAPSGTDIELTVDLARQPTEAETTAETDTAKPDDAATSARDRLRRYRQGTPAGAPATTAAAQAPSAIDRFPHTLKLPVDPRGRAAIDLTLKLEGTGFNAVKLTARATGAAETATAAHPLFVAPDRPRLLLIAERPDRLATALLAQRRHGIQVYPRFTYGREANAKRGSSRGDLPETPADWAQYDLVALLGRPFPGYAASDAEAIGRLVRAGDLALLVSGEGSAAYLDGMGLGTIAPTPLPPADGLALNPRFDHLPAVSLYSEVIANFNAWRAFGAPARLHAVPPQQAPLLTHPHTGAPVLSFGLHGAGKVAIGGLDGLVPMLAWHAPDFDRFVSHLAADLLTPLGRWPESGPALASYPPVGTVGRPLTLVARPAADAPDRLTVQVAGPDGSAAVDLVRDGDWAHGTFQPEATGDYTFSGIGEPITATVSQRESAELRDIGLDEVFLRELANAAGGSYTPIDELPSAIAALAPRSRTHVDTATWHLLDFRLALTILFLLFLGTDFALRKLLGMVL